MTVPPRNQVTTDFRGHHTIPPEFPQILKDFVREILREQPENIYNFGARYFSELANPTVSEEASGLRVFETMSDEELLVWLTEIFVAADSDNNGVLDRKEFKELMSELNLNESEAMQVFMEADIDDSGVLEYEEFLQLMVQVLITISKLDKEKQEEEVLLEAAEEYADDYMLRGMSGAELELLMVQAFQDADTDGSGSLSMAQFKEFIRSCNLNLTKKEMNVLFMSVDTDNSGSIEIDEFFPIFHTVMRKMIADSALKSMNAETVQMLPQILIAACEPYDQEQSGLISHKKLCRGIRDADVGLSSFQIYSVVSDYWTTESVRLDVQSSENPELMDYKRFIEEHIAPAVAKLIDVDMVMEQQVSKEQVAEMIVRAKEELGINPEDFVNVLSEVFVKYDKDNSGYLDPEEFEDALENSGIQFSAKEKMMLLLAADEDGNGQISYGEFASVALQLMIWCKREQYVNPIKQDMGSVMNSPTENSLLDDSREQEDLSGSMEEA